MKELRGSAPEPPSSPPEGSWEWPPQRVAATTPFSPAQGYATPRSVKGSGINADAGPLHLIFTVLDSPCGMAIPISKPRRNSERLVVKATTMTATVFFHAASAVLLNAV